MQTKTMNHTPTPKLLKILSELPLFDENSKDQMSGGLEEIAKDLELPESNSQEEMAESIYENIKTACNAHEDLVNALQRMQSYYSIGNGNEIMCYCDDYKKPEICEHCETKQALAKAGITI